MDEAWDPAAVASWPRWIGRHDEAVWVAEGQWQIGYVHSPYVSHIALDFNVYWTVVRTALRSYAVGSEVTNSRAIFELQERSHG